MKKTLLVPHEKPSPPPKDGDNVTIYLCQVNIEALVIRTKPERKDENIVTTYYKGDTLNFFELVYGETYEGNRLWGHSVQDHFYWMGGTDCPEG